MADSRVECVSDPRYSTQRWKNRRREQLSFNPLCAYCAARGIVMPATVADHVIPHRGDDDLFWYGELQSLCATCHSSHKQAQEKSGVLRGCDAQGAPLDRTHPWFN